MASTFGGRPRRVGHDSVEYIQDIVKAPPSLRASRLLGIAYGEVRGNLLVHLPDGFLRWSRRTKLQEVGCLELRIVGSFLLLRVTKQTLFVVVAWLSSHD